MAITQVGESLVVGFDGNTYTAHIADSASVGSAAEVEAIKDEVNDTVTKLVSDPASTFKGTFILKAAASTTPPAVGSTLTINSVAYFVVSAEIAFSRTVARLTVDLVKEDSMTYS